MHRSLCFFIRSREHIVLRDEVEEEGVSKINEKRHQNFLDERFSISTAVGGPWPFTCRCNVPLEPEQAGGDARPPPGVGSSPNGEPVAPGAVPLRLLRRAPRRSLQVRLRERRVCDAIARALAHQRREACCSWLCGRDAWRQMLVACCALLNYTPYRCIGGRPGMGPEAAVAPLTTDRWTSSP